MPPAAIPTWFFALVVVRLGRRFLLVQERKHGHRWYLPAGRVEPGEPLVAAAVRETREEAGIPVVLDGILRVEHTPAPDGTARCRVIFLAHPADDTPPKQDADAESLQAAWVTVEELPRHPRRGDEVEDLLRYVDGGAPVYPLSLLASEDAARRPGSASA
jgi:phosphatase NudJ